MTSRTVYLVASGEWSSKQWHCAFDTRPLAEAYIAALNARRADDDRWLNEFRIEDLQLWDAVPIAADVDQLLDKLQIIY